MALYIITAVCELVRKLECRAAEADLTIKHLHSYNYVKCTCLCL